jgi:hypothetical protein
MSNKKDYNKSMIFNFQESPRFNVETVKTIKSSEPNCHRLNEETGKNTFKNKLIQIDKDKFNCATKNENFTKRSNIQHKNTIHPNRNKNYYMNILDSIYQNEPHLDRTNVKLKFNQNNTKISSLIPFPKKFSKDKLVKDEDIIKEDVKKRKHSKRKGSENEGNQFNRTNTKKKTKKFNSSHQLIKMKKKSSCSLRKYTEFDKIKDILKEEKTKITKKAKENEEKSKDGSKKAKEDNKSENKKEGNIVGDNIDQENKNINEKENKMNDNNSYDNKEIPIKKKDYNNKEHNKDKIIVDINHVETKSKNEIVKYTNKDKEKGKKKRKGFPLCCFIIKDDSSDND